jgi:hypothetical protein
MKSPLDSGCERTAFRPERVVSPAALAHHPAMPQSETIFLTAEWRWLAMLNYEIDPRFLAPFVPAGTELDFWNGKTYLSLVGFLFRDCRVRGFSIPFHRHFEEVNLRFYVRHKADDGWRRGVVFIKELVPRRAIAFIARTLYNENYFALPMSHRIDKNVPGLSPVFGKPSGDNSPSLGGEGRGEGELSPAEVRGSDQLVRAETISVTYSWRFKRSENFLKLTTRGTPQPPADGSQPEFITEHYWGYARQRDGSTMEYRVEHPRWQVWEAAKVEVYCDVANLYGREFCEFLYRPPASVFLADGSEIKVYRGTTLKR